MNYWQFLDRCLGRLPGWPGERQWVTIGIFALGFYMLNMAQQHPEIWTVELFKVLIQAVFVSALINMVVAFWFAANKSDEQKSENTGKLADAFRSVAENSSGAPASEAASAAADQVAGAAAAAAEDVHSATETRPTPTA